jgi:EAL domain-containing protein (putative c-di-GMP-specific phosphodiesterase class I)
VQKLTGNLFLPAGKAAQGLDLTSIAPDMTCERALTRDVVAPEEHLRLAFDAIIVRSTVDLAHSFGLRVVAEGAEDEATLHLLTALHCDLVQGYYLSRPVPAQELERWLRDT